MSDPPAPQIPEDALGDGWEQTADRTETVFELSSASVKGRTIVYEDTALEATIREATGVEDCSRFVFATRLTFSPPLGPGANTVIKPTVLSEARSEFGAILEERGFEDVERERRQHMRTKTGQRATLFAYRAMFPTGRTSVPIEGWLAVWNDDGFRLAGGAYPSHFGDLDVPADSSGYRDDLLAVLREIE